MEICFCLSCTKLEIALLMSFSDIACQRFLFTSLLGFLCDLLMKHRERKGTPFLSIGFPCAERQFLRHLRKCQKLHPTFIFLTVLGGMEKFVFVKTCKHGRSRISMDGWLLNGFACPFSLINLTFDQFLSLSFHIDLDC